MSPFDPTVLYVDFRGYKVGSDGSIWTCKNNSGRLTRYWRPLSPSLNRKGYFFITLCEGRRRTGLSIARLVLTLFVRPPVPGEDACHKNDVRHDNRLENLFWDTHQNNVRQRDERNRSAHGERNANAKLRSDDIPRIFLMSAQGFSAQRIAADYGVARQTIYMVLKGRTWWRAMLDASHET